MLFIHKYVAEKKGKIYMVVGLSCAKMLAMALMRVDLFNPYSKTILSDDSFHWHFISCKWPTTLALEEACLRLIIRVAPTSPAPQTVKANHSLKNASVMLLTFNLVTITEAS